MTEPETNRPKPKRAGKRAVWGLGTVLMLALLATLGVLALTDRQIAAPDWLRDEITTRLNAQIDGAEISFGEVSLIVQRTGVPRVLLRNVTVSNARGERLAQVSDINGTLALRPLLRGEVQPGTVRLSGAALQVRRSVSGNLGIAVGDNPTPVNEAPSFAALIDQIDKVLQRPALSGLRLIEADNLTIRYEDARAKQGWTVDGGRLNLTRDGDDLRLRGDFALLGNRGFATTLEMNYTGRIGAQDGEFGVNFADMP